MGTPVGWIVNERVDWGAPSRGSAMTTKFRDRRSKGLRGKLMQLSLILTAIGVVLLVISTITLLWLRMHTNDLTGERTPAVIAAQRAQIGLQRSLAGLRG